MSNPNPKFSIVTPVLNRREYIKNAIENVLNQDYPNFEHIVIDGASTDGTLELIRNYSHIRLVSEPDLGSANALNKGLKLIQGDIFGWLNSDERYSPGLFKRVANYFSEYEDVDLIYGTYELSDSKGRRLGKSRFKKFDLHKQILGMNSIAPSAMFMRVRALDGVGRAVDEQWKDAYDHDLWIRIGKQYAVHALDECFSQFMLQPSGGVTIDPMRGAREARKIRTAHGGDKKLLDRCFWIPFITLRLALHQTFKWKRMIKASRSD